jgi:hypothetical protein
LANVDPKQQILLRLVAITVADLAMVGWIVRQAFENGASPIFPTIRRGQQPIGFWLLIVALIVAGLGFAAALSYAVLG